jgi:hypothetical protein
MVSKRIADRGEAECSDRERAHDLGDRPDAAYAVSSGSGTSASIPIRSPADPCSIAR